MPEPSQAAKKFGGRSRHRISAWPKRSWPNFSREHRQRRSNGNGEVSPKMTFGQAAAIHLRNLGDNLNIKPRTREYWREVLAALLKSWPRLNETEVRKITQADCKKWATAYAKLASPTRYNNTLAVLRHVLNVPVETGVIYSNPAAVVKRAAVRGKQIAFPATEKFNALIADMRAGRSRDSINCADLAAGLAFTGCRIGEAREIAWRDVDFQTGEIVVRGDVTTGTKNWELRRVPLIPDARALFERMRRERTDESLETKLFRVRECQKSLDRACKKIGADRITHHDLRICLQRAASKAAWTFRPFPVGWDTRTGARWRCEPTAICAVSTALLGRKR